MKKKKDIFSDQYVSWPSLQADQLQTREILPPNGNKDAFSFYCLHIFPSLYELCMHFLSIQFVYVSRHFMYVNK